MKSFTMPKKNYSNPGTMRDDVVEIENIINDKINSIWADDFQRTFFLKLNKLNLSDKRLFIVYSLLDHSIIKTAKFFKVDRGTCRVAINKIKQILNES